jgi:hypothetical protein
MKKFFIILIFFANFLFALPSNNPSSPSIIKKGFFIPTSNWYSLRIGYEGDFVFDRRLIQKKSNQRVNNFKKYLNSAVLIFNVFNRLDILGIYGETRLKSDWVIEEGTNIYSYLEMETRYKRYWSCGIKAIFFEWKNTSFSIGGRASYSKPEIMWLSKNGEMSVLNKFHVKFYEWQADMGISHKIDIFFPYIALKYSRAKADFAIDDIIIGPNFQTEIEMESKNKIGMALGLSLSSENFFLLNAEVRLFDEEALFISGNFRF